MATKKVQNFDTLMLTLELLRRIPRQTKVTAPELHAELQAAGYDRDLRTIQRLLKALCEQFDIECDSRSTPHGYQWKALGSGLMMPSLNRQESLLLTLAERQLGSLLPPTVMKSMQGFFKQARANLAPHQDAKLEKQWLQKVRVVSETQPLLPPAITPSVLQCVTGALYANHWLDVDYTNGRGQRKQHRIMPLGLAQQGPRMYLVCQFEGHDNHRIMALHRIHHASDTQQSFDRPVFDLAAYDGEGHFAVGEGEFVRLKLTIDKGPGKHILESPLSKDQRVEETPDAYVIEATVAQTLLLDRWLKSFGAQVRQIQKQAL